MAYLGLSTLASVMGIMILIGLCVLFILQAMLPNLLDELRKSVATKVNDILFRT